MTFITLKNAAKYFDKRQKMYVILLLFRFVESQFESFGRKSLK